MNNLEKNSLINKDINPFDKSLMYIRNKSGHNIGFWKNPPKILGVHFSLRLFYFNEGGNMKASQYLNYHYDLIFSWYCSSVLYLESCQTSMLDFFVKIVNDYKLVIVSTEILHH